MSDEVETRQLIISIVEFLRGELTGRIDLTPEDRDSLGIAVDCLELAYGLESHNPRYRRVRRPLLDMFKQVIHPPTVKDRLEAERLKAEGNDKMSQQQYEEALTAYTQAIELDKWNAVYYCNRAGTNIELQHYYDAIADCRQALTLNPDYAKAFGRMGQAYILMDRPRHAARCFQQAVELEPENERYVNNLRTAESQAATAPPGDLMQSILSSLFGQRSEDGGPTGATLTIITEIVPQSSEELAAEANETTGETDESSNPESGGEALTQNQGTEPNTSQGASLLNLALPLMLGLIGPPGGHSHGHDLENDPNQESGENDHFGSGCIFHEAPRTLTPEESPRVDNDVNLTDDPERVDNDQNESNEWENTVNKSHEEDKKPNESHQQDNEFNESHQKENSNKGSNQHDNGNKESNQHDNGNKESNQHDNGNKESNQHDNGNKESNQHDNGNKKSNQHNNFIKESNQHDNENKIFNQHGNEASKSHEHDHERFESHQQENETQGSYHADNISDRSPLETEHASAEDSGNETLSSPDSVKKDEKGNVA